MNHKYRKLRVYLMVICGIIFTMTFSAEAMNWEIIDLEPFDGDARTYGYSINERGQVAGWSADAHGERHAFIWSKETGMISICTPEFPDCEARGLNNLGHVIGYIRIPYQAADSFIWTEKDGMMLIEKGNHPDYEIVRFNAMSINDYGQVVGYMSVKYANGYSNLRGFIWDKENGLRDLNDFVLRDPSQVIRYATDINNKGEILISTYQTLGICSIGGEINELETIEPGDWNYPSALNDSGQATGVLQIYSGHRIGVFWEMGDFTDIGSLIVDPDSLPCLFNIQDFSFTNDINNMGKVVGYTSTDVFCDDENEAHSTGVGFVWDQKSGMINLNEYIPKDSNWRLGGAYSINDKNQITGTGWIDTDGDGEHETLHGYVLIPREINIEYIIEKFDDWVADGSIVGYGKKAWIANLKLYLMKHMLLAAKELIEHDKVDWACHILNRAFLRCDGEKSPIDFVAGNAVQELNDMISELMVQIGCE